ncbi:hypothetical protein KY320_00500 [Candidatus Woesearchaeota archaeon]|nr:hypothetical protein [Candidatus Woesearchaeota archaeon]
METKMPVFVKIEDYKDVLEVLKLLEKKLDAAKESIGKINELQNHEDEELELWNSELKQIEEKLEALKHTLIAPSV